MLKIIEKATGVFYSGEDFVIADHEIIDFLKTAAKRTPLKRARLCAHPSAEAQQQDMLIVCHKSSYIPPHRHLNKNETMIILEGEATLLIFQQDGLLSSKHKLSPYNSDANFFYRMPPNQFHSMTIETDWFVFIESTQGPFDPEESEDADWAPEKNDSASGHSFLAKFL